MQRISVSYISSHTTDRGSCTYRLRCSSENFYSAKLAVDGKMFQNEGWSHPMGSNIVGWIKHFRNSPIVYLQGGDSESALLDQNFGQLVRNAVRWVSSSEAHDWARKAVDSEQSANF